MSSHSLAVEDPQGPPHVHHMEPSTAYQAAKFGMWLFLATEILLFSGLFVAYGIYHWRFHHEFHAASLQLNKFWGLINTVVLLGSSWTAALAVSAAQRGDNKRVVKLLSITVAAGVIFLVVKTIEYTGKWHHGLFPGAPEVHGMQFGNDLFWEKYREFFPLYLCMTGLHALHVVAGMTLIAVWPLRLAMKNRFSGRYFTPVEVGALYWHLVDLIWIYLFPLLYLVG
jgi:cytochrome c oxidase subunit 3